MLLLPSVLARKRAWNPKYPICIQLADAAASLGGEEAVPPGPQESQGEEPDPVDPSTPNREPSHGSKPPPHPPTTLYLFGRTGREKEEWFHNFLFASLNNAGRERDGGKERVDARCVHRAGRGERRGESISNIEKIKHLCEHLCVDYGLYALILSHHAVNSLLR